MTATDLPADGPPEHPPDALERRPVETLQGHDPLTRPGPELATPPGPTREAQRQQLLLQALLRNPQATGALPAWLQGQPQGRARGLQAYLANADASAERALASAFPAVVQLVSAASFAALARAYRQARPSQRGDLAWFGEQLPDFIATDPQLSAVPYLADVARLEWLMDQAERAADVEADPSSLLLLADTDPTALRLQLAPGAALLRSNWPVVAIHQAHVDADGDIDLEASSEIETEAEAARREALIRASAALQRGEAECALVWRPVFKAQVCTLSLQQARFTEAVLQGQSLAQALDVAVDDGFSFDVWLSWALQQGLLRGAVRCGERRAAPPAPGAHGAPLP